MILHVRVDHKCGERVIKGLFWLVANHSEDVETRENWVSQVDVVVEVLVWLVDTADWVGCSDDRASSLQGSNDASLRD